MSCPDWRALADRRETDPDEAPEWQQALSHLDDCPACQDAASAVEPTLLFRRLPTFESGNDEVEAMKRAVASMRRGQTIERQHKPPTRSWLRAAALAAVLLGSLMLRGAGSPPSSTEPAVIAAPAAAASAIDLRRLPLIEAVDPTYGSIIQVVDDDISLVLVVRSEIDV